MLNLEQFKELRKKGLSPQQIASFEAGNTPFKIRGDVDTPPQIQPQKKSFIGSQLTGQTEEREGFLGNLFQETLGSKGVLGAFQLPGKVAGTLTSAKTKQALSESTQGLADQTTKLIKSLQGVDDQQRKQRLQDIIQDNLRVLKEGGMATEELEKTMITPKEAIATTLRAAATVAPVKGAGFLRTSLKTGRAGAGFGLASGIESGEDVKGMFGSTGLGFAGGAVVPGAGKFAVKLGKPIFTNLVSNPIKGLAKNVSNFFFGPEGTSGLSVRFEDPALSGFLKTSRRQPGGQTLENIVTMLDKSVRSVVDTMGKKFQVAEEKIIQKPLRKETIFNDNVKVIKEALSLDKISRKNIADSGLSDPEVRVVQRVVNELNSMKDFTTKGVLKLRRKLDNLYRGTKASEQSDRIVTIVRKNLNKTIEGVDKDFAEASKGFAKDKDFINKVRANIIGKSKDNVDQTADKIYQLAKSLDNPFRREATEKLLLELSKRSGIDYLKLLKALKTAENLYPQGSMGFRAGVIRELTRMAQLTVSAGASVAGKTSRGIEAVKVKAQELPQDILSQLSAGTERAGTVGAVKGIEDLFNK